MGNNYIDKKDKNKKIYERKNISNLDLSKHLMSVICDKNIENLKVYYHGKFVEEIPLIWFIYTQYYYILNLMFI